jgi:hypothetical protein
MSFLQQKSIMVMSLPSTSLNLNPIKHKGTNWADVSDADAKQKPTTLADIQETLQEEWNNNLQVVILCNQWNMVYNLSSMSMVDTQVTDFC